MEYNNYLPSINNLEISNYKNDINEEFEFNIVLSDNKPKLKYGFNININNIFKFNSDSIISKIITNTFELINLSTIKQLNLISEFNDYYNKIEKKLSEIINYNNHFFKILNNKFDFVPENISYNQNSLYFNLVELLNNLDIIPKSLSEQNILSYNDYVIQNNNFIKNEFLDIIYQKRLDVIDNNLVNDNYFNITNKIFINNKIKETKITFDNTFNVKQFNNNSLDKIKEIPKIDLIFLKNINYNLLDNINIKNNITSIYQKIYFSLKKLKKGGNLIIYNMIPITDGNVELLYLLSTLFLKTVNYNSSIRSISYYKCLNTFYIFKIFRY